MLLLISMLLRWEDEMHVERGMTLVITLIFTSVIAMLVMANLHSQQLGIKISNIFQEQQANDYELQKNLKNFLLTRPWLNTDCIQKTKPNASYPVFSNEVTACVWQNYEYVLFEGGSECCFFSDGQSAKIYYVYFSQRKSSLDGGISASIIVRDLKNICQCQTMLNADEGLLSMQFQRR